MAKEVLGNRIAEERKKLGLSQAELAKKVKISQSAVAKQETGANCPSVETLEDYADLFGVTTDYLLGRTDNPHIHVIDNPPEFKDMGVTELRRSGTEPFTPEQIEAIKREIEKHIGK